MFCIRPRRARRRRWAEAGAPPGGGARGGSIGSPSRCETAAATPGRQRWASLPHLRIHDAGGIRWGVGEGGRSTFDRGPGPGRPHSFAGRGGGAAAGAAAAADRPTKPVRPHPPAASQGIRTLRAHCSRWGAPRPACAIDGRPLASKSGREEGPAPAGGLCGGSFNMPDVPGNKPRQNPTEEASDTTGEEGRQELTE